MTESVALIGTGADPDDPGSDGYAMAYRHAGAYERLEGCEIVACADIVRENAESFADAHDIGPEGIFEDYSTMLREATPDVVSVCVPPSAHADIVCGCADTGIPGAIHCEKPMATSWGDCRRMVRTCSEADVQLTINHQRRVGPIFRKAKELLDEGEIGELSHIEVSAKNLLDAGTHLFDLSTFYTEAAPVEWVLAGVEYSEENKWFGTHNENQAVAQWQYASGVSGLAVTGDGSEAVDPYIALTGTDGRIELGASEGPPFRYRTSDTTGWETIDMGETIWGNPTKSKFRAGLELAARRAPIVSDELFAPAHVSHIDRAIEEVVSAYRDGRDSELRGAVALTGTELIFAAYESARRRGRVDLPLEIDDNPLESMVENGIFDVGAEAAATD